jgi:hypothetical protein
MPNYIGHWIFTFTAHDTCIIFMNGVELYHRLHPQWTFTYHEVRQGATVAKEIVLAKGENPPAGKKETKEIRETDKKINRDNENPPHEGTHKERGKK